MKCKTYLPFPFFAFLLLGLWFNIIACDATPTTAVASTPTTSSLQWLYGVPCRIPCFVGLTPGTTRPAEVQALLTQNGAVNIQDDPPGRISFSNGYISWTWNGMRAGTEYSERDANTKIGSIIGVLPQPIQLGKIIEVLGEPSEVFVVAGIVTGENRPSRPAVSLVYRSLGLTVLDGEENLTIANRIDKDLKIREVVFFAPTPEGYAAMLEAKVTYSLPIKSFAWHGFDTVGAYCTDVVCRGGQSLTP